MDDGRLESSYHWQDCLGGTALGGEGRGVDAWGNFISRRLRVRIAGRALRRWQRAEQPVPNVLSAPTLGRSQRRYRGQADGVFQLVIGRSVVSSV